MGIKVGPASRSARTRNSRGIFREYEWTNQRFLLRISCRPRALTRRPRRAAGPTLILNNPCVSYLERHSWPMTVSWRKCRGRLRVIQ